jgi:hypothetical protein
VLTKNGRTVLTVLPGIQRHARVALVKTILVPADMEEGKKMNNANIPGLSAAQLERLARLTEEAGEVFNRL